MPCERPTTFSFYRARSPRTTNHPPPNTPGLRRKQIRPTAKRLGTQITHGHNQHSPPLHKTLQLNIPPPDKSPNAKLHNAIIDLHTHDVGILAGQEPCIDFKQKGQNQELKYAYMKKFRNSRTTTACSKIPAANDTYLPGCALIATLGKFSVRVIASGSDAMGRWA